LCRDETSGSGKSTLLNIVGLLDRTTRGTLQWQATRLDDRALALPCDHTNAALARRCNKTIPLVDGRVAD
jgi:ABC-type lipoprotein export system ATPase subunit